MQIYKAVQATVAYQSELSAPVAIENKILAKAGVSRDSDVRNADQFAAEGAAKEAEENAVKEAPAPKVEAVEEEEKKAA